MYWKLARKASRKTKMTAEKNTTKPTLAKPCIKINNKTRHLIEGHGKCKEGTRLQRCFAILLGTSLSVFSFAAWWDTTAQVALVASLSLIALTCVVEHNAGTLQLPTLAHASKLHKITS